MVEGARPITVVVADDHELFRRGMPTVLGMEATFDVLAQARDGEEAVAKVASSRPSAPHRVRMPAIDGIEAARRIRESAPSTPVVMLTVSDEEDHLYGAVRAGANG